MDKDPIPILNEKRGFSPAVALQVELRIKMT